MTLDFADSLQHRGQAFMLVTALLAQPVNLAHQLGVLPFQHLAQLKEHDCNRRAPRASRPGPTATSYAAAADGCEAGIRAGRARTERDVREQLGGVDQNGIPSPIVLDLS
jgi:hypothetical protein